MTRLAGKRLLMVLIPIFVCFLLLYIMVNAAYTPSAEEMRYPQGELTDSIFVGQNNIYTENTSLTGRHAFNTVPYRVDLPSGKSATIGSGTVYQVADTVFVYVSEYPDVNSIHDIITEQFPPALLIDYIPEETKVKTMVDKYGFINGFSAEYLVEHIAVNNGLKEMNAVIMGYVLTVQDESFIGNQMFVGIGTTSYSNDIGESCAEILDAMINTVRKDTDLEYKILRRRTNGSEAENSEKFDGSVTNIPIVLRDDFDEMILHVDWTKGNGEAVLELFFPDGLTFGEPVEQTGNYAKFVLDNVKHGVYNLRIQNSSGCGDVSTRIESHVREGG